MSVGQAQVSDDEIFYCRREKDNVEAKGFYQGNGFLLLKDSRLSVQQFSSLHGAKEKVIYQRAYMIREGILVERGGGVLVLQSDYWLPGPPSFASNVVLGYSSNGWIAWVNSKGETLDEVYRRPKKSKR